MIKDIVLSLPLNDGKGDVTGYAVSLAGAFKARLTGVAFAYEKMPLGLLGDERWVESVEQLCKEAEDAAKGATGRFRQAANSAGVAIETRLITTTFRGTAEQFGRLARRFDLAVAQQSEAPDGSADHLIIQAALFDSGRPVLVVPAARKGAAKFDRVIVCWDGGRAAARALADAFPFLQRAKAIELLTIGDRAKGEGLPVADIAIHLGSHGLVVETREINADDLNVTDQILSRATESGADLIVMGAYGHSRLREFVLGGATRGVLAAMPAPTLLSH
jgi:nucleotide-binding universal stress UspA family protein